MNEPPPIVAQKRPSSFWKRVAWIGGGVLFLACAAVVAMRGPATDEKRLLAALDARGPETRIQAWLREFGVGPPQESPATIVERIVHRRGVDAIPFLIGVIDADNSYESIYWIGHFHLRPLTGVDFSFFHDGAWWRRWWETHNARFPDAVRLTPIPQLPKTRAGKAWKAFPDDIDSLKGKLRLANQLIPEWQAARIGGGTPSRIDPGFYARDVAGHLDPHAIPYLIALVGTCAKGTYDIGYFGLLPLTGVSHDSTHDSMWWHQWWAEHSHEFPADVARIDIPDPTQPWTFDWQETPMAIEDQRRRRKTRLPENREK